MNLNNNNNNSNNNNSSNQNALTSAVLAAAAAQMANASASNNNNHNDNNNNHGRAVSDNNAANPHAIHQMLQQTAAAATVAILEQQQQQQQQQQRMKLAMMASALEQQQQQQQQAMQKMVVEEMVNSSQNEKTLVNDEEKDKSNTVSSATKDSSIATKNDNTATTATTKTTDTTDSTTDNEVKKEEEAVESVLVTTESNDNDTTANDNNNNDTIATSTNDDNTDVTTTDKKRKRKTSSSNLSSPSKKKTKKSKSTTKATPSSPTSKKTKSKSNTTSPSSSANKLIDINNHIQPTLEQNVPPMTEQQYTNLDLLMAQFCKVPLLAEFSRPVSLLHPELIPLYSKVVKDPIDLGKVCRAIRRRQYHNTRQVCVDVWRIFANCVKYHTHPLTREGAIPSFVSIANHLREYFNALWLEYMIPSEINTTDNKDPYLATLKNAEAKRKKLREERSEALAATILSSNFMERAAKAIESFVELGGRVDLLDDDKIVNINSDDDDGDEAIQSVFHALTNMAARLRTIAPTDVEYPAESLCTDLKRCISEEKVQTRPWLRVKLEKRLDRLLGKLMAPINEASCRGVNQSSVWGCMAAAIWARETTKRPYWPALVLGILAPADQKEEWHRFLTERNESRLPIKLQQGLEAGKKKAIHALEKQNEGKAERMSFFLVEFLGTHEFIWVREADIIEQFNPDEDVNDIIAKQTGKRKKSLGRNQAPNPKLLQRALEEGRWALDEFDMQLNDPCGDQLEEYDEEENYSYPILCESDDEADEADTGLGDQDYLGDKDNFGSPTGKLTDVEEINELLLTDGILDFSTNGRKNAKKRAAALKKQLADAKKSELKKEKEEKAKKAKTNSKKVTKTSSTKGSPKNALKKSRSSDSTLQELKDLEKRRKKRERERILKLKQKESNAKKSKIDGSSVVRRGRKLGIIDKKGRASAIVRGYLHRLSESNDLKGLGLSGVLTIPAANVESTGLLGIALAFRAAAGELEMPTKDENASTFKPWENIDVNGPLNSEERCSNLEKKIKMIENAIETLKKNDSRRKELIEITKKEIEVKRELILKTEKDARKNDMPKRKPVGKKKGSQTTAEDKDESSHKEDEEIATAIAVEDNNESPVEVTIDVA